MTVEERFDRTGGVQINPHMAHHPILWTFRRCPYAIRARLALASSGIKVELREVRLKDKPQAFLQTSASGTVPALTSDMEHELGFGLVVVR